MSKSLQNELAQDEGYLTNIVLWGIYLVVLFFYYGLLSLLIIVRK
jgi:hypothetical protein